MRRFKKIIRFIIWGIVISSIFTIVFSYFAFFYIPDKLYKQTENHKTYDVIIVPGVPYKKNGWSKIMKMRVYWSYYLYKKGIARNIIYSGGAVYTPFIESKIMALYGEKLGIPSKNIYTESDAEHSTENLYYSCLLAKKLGFKSIALATDPFQNAMLWNFKDDINAKIQMIPIVIKLVRGKPEQEITIDPSSALKKNFESIVKRESFIERFKGTLGKKIDYVE